jgi:catechol 2,3-dioxygenase-like lactoylglutathione lyase family enzyme
MSERKPWRDGPILAVRDVKKAVGYYTGTLGFECPGGIFEGVAAGEGGVYAIVRRADVEIQLQICRREIFPGEREDIESDTYVFVDDVDALEVN